MGHAENMPGYQKCRMWTTWTIPTTAQLLSLNQQLFDIDFVTHTA